MAEAQVGYTRAVADDQVLIFVYTDHRGSRSTRRVLPDRIWFGRTDWYDEPQWLMDAYDVDRHALRSFALRQIQHMGSDTGMRVPNGPADQSSPGRVQVRG